MDGRVDERVDVEVDFGVDPCVVWLAGGVEGGRSRVASLGARAVTPGLGAFSSRAGGVAAWGLIWLFGHSREADCLDICEKTTR